MKNLIGDIEVMSDHDEEDHESDSDYDSANEFQKEYPELYSKITFYDGCPKNRGWSDPAAASSRARCTSSPRRKDDKTTFSCELRKVPICQSHMPSCGALACALSIWAVFNLTYRTQIQSRFFIYHLYSFISM